jgi:hypothetical protein
MKKTFRFIFPALLFFACNGAENKTVSVDSDATLNKNVSAKKIVVDSADMFLGEVRAAAKTSYVKSISDTFYSMKRFRKWLPDDEYMHKSTDAKHQDSPRTAEENKNVTLTDIYIYGVKREDDNDFHVLLGPSLHTEKGPHFFSAEISGLPDPSSPDFAQMLAVRDQFKAYFGKDAKKETVFVASEKNPPIHLQYITGSLFFDNHHYSGHSAVQGYKSFSAWEIHPVMSIGFDPKK